MEGLKLLDVKIEKITFINDIFIPDVNGHVDIKIGTKISSKVNYNLQEKKCKCTTTVELAPINYDVNFKVEISVVGIFDLGENKDNKQIHVEACKKLFPHVQSRVASFMTMAGMPNFTIEEPQIDVEDVRLSEWAIYMPFMTR